MQRLYNHPFLTSIIITAIFDTLFLRSSSMFVEPGIEAWGRYALLYIIAVVSLYLFFPEEERDIIKQLGDPGISLAHLGVYVAIAGSGIGLVASLFLYKY